MNVLLVDDDPELRFIAAFLLRQAGHDVVEAGDDAEAAAACASSVPDVILMDVLLGAADGVAVAAALRSGCEQPPPVIFLTGVARDDQLARLHAAAPAGIIRKPFQPDTFAATVQRLLDGAS
jgi:CheY-like chemotaxis protein